MAKQENPQTSREAIGALQQSNYPVQPHETQDRLLEDLVKAQQREARAESDKKK